MLFKLITNLQAHIWGVECVWIYVQPDLPLKCELHKIAKPMLSISSRALGCNDTVDRCEPTT